MAEVQPSGDQLRQIVNRNTLFKMTPRWVRNIIKNEELIKKCRGVNDFFVSNNSEMRFKDVPAIVVGSGPSLNKNVRLLKEVKNKAIIVASDSALKHLMTLGIKPHVVVCLDAEWGEWGSPFKDLPMSTEGMVLIVEVFVNRKILDDWKGEIYWFSVQTDENNILGQVVEPEFTGHPVGKLICGGCVSSIGFSFVAGALQCDPTILIGQDLGYYDPTYHHADGIDTPHEHVGEEVQTDIYGRPIFVTPVFKAYKDWFERMVCGRLEPGFPSVNGTFINATEGGTLKGGWLVQPLEYTINKYLTKEYDIDAMLEKRHNAIKEGEAHHTIKYEPKKTTAVSITKKKPPMKPKPSGVRYIKENGKERKKEKS